MQNSERARKIDTLAGLPQPIDGYNPKYRKPIAQVLVMILLAIVVFFSDYYLLPHKKTDDVISYYQTIEIVRGSRYQKSKTIAGYRFYTLQGFDFCLERTPLSKPDVTIEHTLLFKNIKGVTSTNQDYSDELISDFNGLSFYVLIILAISCMISLRFLLYDKYLTENTFMNILIFNGLMLFYIIYLYWLHG